MSRDATYPAASNLLRLLKMILESYYGLHSFSEIRDHLEISEKTLNRYVKVLEEVFPRYIGVKKGSSIGREPAKEKFLIFNRFELESRTGYQLAPLYLSRFFMSFLEGTLLDDSLSDAVSMFESAVESSGKGSFSRKFFAVGFGPKSYADKDDVIEQLLQGLMRQIPLKISYRKPGSAGPGDYLLHPLTLVIYKQGLYLIAAKADAPDEKPRFFAVDRIERCDRQKGETFEYPRNYSPQDLCEGSFGIFQGERTRVVLEFEEQFARNYIAPRRWHSGQKIEYMGDGTARLSMEITGTEELFTWVLGFGNRVQVLEPAALREEMKKELQLMLKRY